MRVKGRTGRYQRCRFRNLPGNSSQKLFFIFILVTYISPQPGLDKREEIKTPVPRTPFSRRWLRIGQGSCWKVHGVKKKVSSLLSNWGSNEGEMAVFGSHCLCQASNYCLSYLLWACVALLVVVGSVCRVGVYGSTKIIVGQVTCHNAVIFWLKKNPTAVNRWFPARCSPWAATWGPLV